MTIPQQMTTLGIVSQVHLDSMLLALRESGFQVELDAEAGTVRALAKFKGEDAPRTVFAAIEKTDAAPGTWLARSLPGLLSRA